jgi:hypothetical protein
MKKQNIKFLLGLISVFIGVLSFYLLSSFILNDVNIQKVFTDTEPSDIFIPNYYTHPFKIFGIFFVCCFISLMSYRKISQSTIKNKVGAILVVTALGSILLYISLPFTVFKTDSLILDSLITKKVKINYSEIQTAIINSVITFHRSGVRGSGGSCALEHGVSFPNVLDGEIVLRGINHEKIKLIRQNLEKHNVKITYTSSIQAECIEGFSPEYINELKNKLVEDLSY